MANFKYVAYVYNAYDAGLSIGDDISVKLGFSHLSNTCCFLCLPDERQQNECQHFCFWLLVTELMQCGYLNNFMITWVHGSQILAIF